MKPHHASSPRKTLSAPILPTSATALLMAVALVAFRLNAEPIGVRSTLSLDGTWQVAEGTMATAPLEFNHTVAVPGLIDLAKPAFPEVGVKSARREAFWYRRSFRVDSADSPVAVLKVGKAMFGTRVFLNGKSLGDHLPCFTPGYFDARAALREGDNEILIRVGAFHDSIPKPIPSGWDYEKYKFAPGIFDSVELIQSGFPHIDRVQAVPDLERKAVTVYAWVRSPHEMVGAPLSFTVREAKGGRVVGEATGLVTATSDKSKPNALATISIRNCRPWSPELAFLYELEVHSTADAVKTRFGMRTFKFDPATGRAMLNGQPYFMRGSNVTLYRFFEDSECADKPWREEWVRRLHRAFRDMHWNCLRYCIGFPPESWYRIADEEGFLIQDEFPIWNMDPKPGDFDANELASEYTEWMQERWNHPCVVVWDACNETRSAETGKALQQVRSLDFSNRPWDNGWSAPQDPSDSFESHPYHFYDPNYKLERLAKESGVPTGNANPNGGHNAVIINEYGWLWLNRDGTPTTLTKDLYRNLLGTNSTPAQNRHLYARYLAAETEFWRSHRAAAAVMHFCALGYSRPGDQPRPEGGATSDHWTDVEKLTWEPEFYRYVRDAFNPVGVMIDAWAADYPAGVAHEFPVVIINDLSTESRGKVRLRVVEGRRVIQERVQPCQLPALGEQRLAFKMNIPASPGQYQLVASLMLPGSKHIESLRDFRVISEAERLAEVGIALGKPVKASSSVTRAGATSPEAVTDGRLETRWSSEFADPQWIAIDLEKTERVSRVRLDWEQAYAKAYSIEVSSDGKDWKEAYRTDNGKGGSEVVEFAPIEARWVRLSATRRATEYGCSLWEFRVFRAP